MVRLEKDKLQGDLIPPAKKAHNIETESPQNTNSEIEKFSLFVLRSTIDDGVPPTPNNFQIYFEKLLDNKPLPFKKRMKEYLDSDEMSTNECRAQMEKDIKAGFTQIKGIVKVVSTIYKNLNIMKQIIKKRADELKNNTGQLSIDHTLSKLSRDIEKLTTLTGKQTETLKNHYDKTIEIFKEVEEKAIFDLKYGIYNKKYFLSSLQKEIDAVKQYKHKSSIVMVRVKTEVLDKIEATREKEVLIRNISKLLMKTSRRSDIVAHYGDRIFAILMKHTDLASSKKACERIGDLIYGTSFFIGEMEIDIDIELGTTPINPNYNMEEMIASVLDVLPKTGKNKDIYQVAQLEGEKA